MTTAERTGPFVRHSLLIALLRKFVLLPSYLLVLLIRLLKWLVAPPALLAQLLIGVPLTLLRIRQPLRPRFAPLSEADLPDAAWITLSDASDSLAAEGFAVYGDFRCDAIHHDGTNHYLYRAYKDGVSDTQIDNLKEKLYRGIATRADITRVTRRLGDEIAHVYGFPIPRRQAPV